MTCASGGYLRKLPGKPGLTKMRSCMPGITNHLKKKIKKNFNLKVYFFWWFRAVLYNVELLICIVLKVLHMLGVLC